LSDREKRARDKTTEPNLDIIKKNAPELDRLQSENMRPANTDADFAA
jgi:hypothetical protein